MKERRRETMPIMVALCLGKFLCFNIQHMRSNNNKNDENKIVVDGEIEESNHFLLENRPEVCYA